MSNRFQVVRANRRARRKPGELRVYARGEHGFGKERRRLPVTSWTARLRDWMTDRGYFRPPG